MNKPQTGVRGRPDFLLLILTLVLTGFGLVMVFSASSNIAAVSDIYRHDALYFIKRQLIWAILGTFVMLLLMNIRYSVFKKGFALLLIPVLILLILVPFVGKEINGARSWFGVGSLGIQPTEPAKLALILYLGALISKKGEKFRDFKKGLVPVIVIVGFICGIVMLQPDLGSCLVLISCALIMIVAGGANLKQLFMTGTIGAVVVAVISAIMMLVEPLQWQYRISRFTSYLDPLADPLGDGFQLVKSLEALGHGGLMGAGLGHSIQKLQYLPYAYNDFIFAVIGEELGFIGSVVFLFFYMMLLWRGLIVAVRCPDVYGTVVGAGIVGLIAVQAIINIGGVTGTIPITGVTLPFISYGGSSLLVTLMAMGVLLSISREYNRPAVREVREERAKPQQDRKIAILRP
ncbi:putative lipid II flippase FtsW [Paenibacillus beijingensis]|uniref:Stage V sporulation protein E n=1 Tax=Paenibacillus beijingensis TaxID=1126833 RepID=A0A0D5NND4_9BACL|nr:putative lipid II flippase FtsW [Paenibacillus beijingensis]AJY76438.1 stage V sporulation protein E [Paenibacillus beijingensis]